jgi:hypothetical protein
MVIMFLSLGFIFSVVALHCEWSISFCTGTDREHSG